MSKENELTSGAHINPDSIARISKRVKESDYEEAVSAYLMKQFHVGSIDELLSRRGIYSAVAEIDILLDELEAGDKA